MHLPVRVGDAGENDVETRVFCRGQLAATIASGCVRPRDPVHVADVTWSTTGACTVEEVGTSILVNP